MKVTEAHYDRGLQLVTQPEAWTPAEAHAGYLAAVERIEVDELGQAFVTSGLDVDDPHDEPGHSVTTLCAGTDAGGITLTVGTEYEQGEEVLGFDGAEALAYELLALVDYHRRGELRHDGDSA